MERRNFLQKTLTSLLAIIPAAKLLGKTDICTTGQDDEGPYFKTGAPFRKNVAVEYTGKESEPLVLQGRVFGACDQSELSKAEIDLWHAHPAGDYDMDGYICRGRQNSDSNGSYQFETVMPARYPGRPLHLHIKVTMPGYKPLTTQVYFAKDTQRKRDYLFRRNKGADRSITIKNGRGNFDIYLEKA